MASSSSGGASFFACIIRDKVCVAFKIISDRLNVGVFIAWFLNLKVSVNLTTPVSVTVLMMQ